MDAIMTAAAGGMRARMEALDMLANNLANASTTGYKSDRERYGLYISPYAEAASAEAFSTLPLIERQWTDFNQGTLTPTGNPLDLALSGPGFFAAELPGGPAYTRNGNFRLSPAGVLVTADGHPVRATGGGTIQATGTTPVEISLEGDVRQDGVLLGRLEIVNFALPEALQKLGNNYFRPGADQSPITSRAAVHQGNLEGSNTSTAESAVRLINILRHFEMLQKAAALGGEMNRKAVEEVARVGQ